MSAPAAAVNAATPEPAAIAGLYAKLLAAAREVGRVPERGRNEAQGYSYAREDDLVEAVREHLYANGVLLLPDVEDVATRDTQRLDRDTGQVLPGWPITRVKMRFAFVDAESGVQRVLGAVGEGSDPGDKGVYKAMTGALKYVLRQSFLIPTGDDAEAESSPPAGAPPQGGRAPRLATDGQQRMLFARAKAAGLTNAERDARVQAIAGVSDLAAIPMDLVDAVKRELDKPPRDPDHPTDVPYDPADFPTKDEVAAAQAEYGSAPPADDDVPFS